MSNHRDPVTVTGAACAAKDPGNIWPSQAQRPRGYAAARQQTGTGRQEAGVAFAVTGRGGGGKHTNTPSHACL